VTNRGSKDPHPKVTTTTNIIIITTPLIKTHRMAQEVQKP